MSATIPAPHAEHFRVAEASGNRAAEMTVSGGPYRSELVTPAELHSATFVMQAIGVSHQQHHPPLGDRQPNAYGYDLDMLDEVCRIALVLIDLKPSGAHQMEHLMGSAVSLCPVSCHPTTLLHPAILGIGGRIRRFLRNVGAIGCVRSKRIG